MLLPNLRGNYHFLPGIEPYSSGVVADPGYEIIHVTLVRACPYEDGFEWIAGHLDGAGRPRQALCAIELRSPVPYTRAGFVAFNTGYRALLEAWDLLVEGQNPVARTNVAPKWHPPGEPALYGFSYTAPADPGSRRTFVVAGAGELRGGPIAQAPVIRASETSTDAMAEKAAYVVKAISRRIEGLGVAWDDVTTTSVYTIQPIAAALGAVVLDAIGPATAHGLRWYHARPPIADLEFEMDARGVRAELHL